MKKKFTIDVQYLYDVCTEFIKACDAHPSFPNESEKENAPLASRQMHLALAYLCDAISEVVLSERPSKQGDA